MREVDQEVTSLLEPPPSTGPDPPMADSPPPLLLASDWWSGDGRVPGGSLVDGGIEGVPCSAIQADFMQASLEASPPIAMSASMKRDGLVVYGGRSEGLPLGGVFSGLVQGALVDPVGTGGHKHPGVVEGAHGNLEARALA